ncbi:TetR/AcrR family transcriptional regulator [Streptomyces sp. NPDC052040]|uniref:TetR/AcrR family transcriptional regulator n=1 Tax=unclassified Streptomyces TaxID=2593676 RepID=UPI0037D00C33
MGLRELKKLKTKREVQRQALRLFTEQGYEATTVEQIAHAAEISTATFYRYFRDKKDVLFNSEYDPFLEDVFTSRPADEPLAGVVRHVFCALASQLLDADREALLMRHQLVTKIPELRARLNQEATANIEQLTELIARRTGRDADKDLGVRLAAMTANAAFAAAVLYWLDRHAQPDLTELIEFALHRVEDALDL